MPKPNRPTKAQIRSAFGKAIRSLRLKTGLSQEKLAHELKIDRGNLASAEAGRHNPTLYTVWTLLPGLRVSVTEFFAGFDRNRR